MSRYSLILFFGLICFLSSTVSADQNITLFTPVNGSSCVVGPDVEFKFYVDEDVDTCELWHNNSGIWSLEYQADTVTTGYHTYNSSVDPNTIIWNVECTILSPEHIEWAINNFTAVITDAPYCAVLDSTSCPDEVNIGSEGVFKTRLSNTLGYYLENQDCNVWVENMDGEVVKPYPSMIYQQEVIEQLDEEGNWMNIVQPEFPLTDSLGWYVFPFTPKRSWAWVGDGYVIHAVCNGQETTCGFNVTSSRLPDMEDAERTLKSGGGVFIIFLIVLLLAATFIGVLRRKLRK